MQTGDEGLREQEARTRAMVRSALDPIVTIDATGRTIEFNPAAERLFGWSRDEVIGQEMARYLVPPRMRTRHRRGLARYLATHEAAILGRRLEMPALRANGSEIPVELTVVRVEFEDPAAPEVFTATLRDLTAQHEAALQNARLAALVASSRDAIIGKTLDGTIEMWNPGAEAIYGYAAGEMIGRNIRTLVPPERASEIDELHARVRRGEGIDNFETTRVTKDGRRVDVAITLSPIPGPGGVIAGISTFTRDITAAKAMETQLLGAQKLESIGMLAGGIAHEFNNILQAVRGHAELILADLDGGPAGSADVPAIQRAVSEIGAGAERAAALTRQLIAFSRQQILTPTVVDPRDAVRAIEPLLRPLLGDRIRLALELDADTGSVRVDAGQLEQIVVNLVANARDAMPEGGTLTIGTRNVEVAGTEAGQPAPAVPPGSYVVLAVSDTGTGMDRATRDHIFEPFFSTKEPGKGTGLGLAATHGVVHQSGGHISVSSEPGAGAMFELHFPRVDGEIEAVAPLEALPRRVGGTILVVDDEPSVRHLAVRVLERAGYTVVAAAEGRAGLDALQGSAGSLIALVSDVVMPGMSGPELARTVLREQPGIGVILMSGYLPGTLDISDLLAGGARFVAKPFAPAELVDAVGETLRS